ncbi:MAG: Isocitrate dehydrogenase [Oscillospiraceae bacterium]
MTAEELKRLDKKVMEIQDPLGTGMPTFKKICKDFAEKKQVPAGDVFHQYMRWKWSKI